MKELIEEKAKRYDGAIEKMQSMMKSWETLSYNGKTFLQDIKYIFPELKESEDEKIRKSLIKGFKRYFSESVFNGILVKDILAWLEKQGEKGINGKNREIPFSEQKPTDKIQLGKKYKCIASPRYSTFMIGEIYKPEDKFLCSLMNFCYDCFEPIEDGEQKPAEKFPKYKKGDILTDGKNKYEVLSWDYTETGIAAYYMKGAGFKFSCNCEEVDKKLYIVEQKPQRMVSAEAKEAMYDKPAWSEEDEKYLIYNIEQDYRDKLNNNPPESLRPYYNKVISLLKSIRHQKQWKPSDEQMYILNWVTNLLNDGMVEKHAKGILESLYNDLKKLKA